MASKLKDAKTNINSVRFSTDNGKEKVPEGATILKKDVSVSVEEIENGFIISKSFDIKYSKSDDDCDDCGNGTGYAYYTLKWYSEDNPLSINTEDKELADLFD